MSKEIDHKEIRFAVHIPKTDYRDDCHYVKEQIYYKDGSIEPRTFLVKDYVRPVWVVSEAYRNYNDKKEFEYKDKLLEIKTTQSDINRTVANALGKGYLATQIDELKSSPYIYGYDQTSTSLIKLQNLIKNKFIQDSYTVAGFDIETDIDTEEILIATVVFQNKIYSCVLRKLLKGRDDVQGRVLKAVEKYLPEYKDLLDITVKVFDDEVSLLKSVFKVANQWKPDFLEIWNMNFDIPRCLDRLKMNNVNPIEVICDQSVPRSYRVCRYKQGATKKITASGVLKPMPPSLQWHSLISTTTFYVIDGMCVYRQLRMAKQEEPSYSLDAILTKHKKRQKLKFSEADEHNGASWHVFMQQNYPIEYIVYNFYDCLAMLELDKDTRDLSNSLPSFAGMTDFGRFNSNPKKIVDALFLFGLERNQVVGTVGKIKKKEEEADVDDISDDLLGEEDENDPSRYKSLNLKGWIQLLPQANLLAEGLKCLEDYPNVVTNVRGLVSDLDAKSAYPTCTMVANVSKRTCVNELISIDGLSEEQFREQNLSVCLGGVNSLEYFTTVFNLPRIDELEQYLD